MAAFDSWTNSAPISQHAKVQSSATSTPRPNAFTAIITVLSKSVLLALSLV